MKIQGIEIKIDQSIQALCEMCNKSSASSRGILYVVIVTSILALIAVVNTHKENWAIHRQNTELEEINRYRKLRNHFPDTSIQYARYDDTLFLHREVLNRLIGNRVERLQTVSVPILGNSFDINNLALVVGVTFIVLLVILRFTLKREHSNLVITLNAITERYSIDADETLFLPLAPEKSTEEFKKQFLSDVNMIRRKYHYNFLSMNDIFTLPTLKVNSIDYSASAIESRAVMIIFWLPFIIYFLIVGNDISTGWGYYGNKVHTNITLCIGILFMIPVFILSYKCNAENSKILSQYKLFKQQDYSFGITSLQ